MKVRYSSVKSSQLKSAAIASRFTRLSCEMRQSPRMQICNPICLKSICAPPLWEFEGRTKRRRYTGTRRVTTGTFRQEDNLEFNWDWRRLRENWSCEKRWDRISSGKSFPLGELIFYRLLMQIGLELSQFSFGSLYWKILLHHMERKLNQLWLILI